MDAPHVLVVEDEPLLREAVARDLVEVGFRVEEAGTAEAALATIEEAAAASGPPHVVVTGLHLGPGLDGLALGAEVLRRWPKAGVVYMTWHPDALDGRLLGPREHYIVKPVVPETLLHAVRRLMPAWMPPWAGLGHAVAAAFGLAGASEEERSGSRRATELSAAPQAHAQTCAAPGTDGHIPPGTEL